MSKPNEVQKLAAELSVLAKAATPGPWITDGDYVNEHGHVLYTYIASGRKLGGRIANTFANCLVKTDEQCQANAAFIAGANPKAVLLLIAEIERQAGQIKELKRMHERVSASVIPALEQRDDLLAVVEIMVGEVAHRWGSSFTNSDLDIAGKAAIAKVKGGSDE